MSFVMDSIVGSCGFNVGCSVFIKYPDTGIASIHLLVPGLLQSIAYIQRVVLGIVG